MLTISELVDLGFSRSRAELLLRKNDFVLRTKNWDKQEFNSRMEAMERVYSASREQVIKAILSYPKFAGLDHSRVLRQAMEVYGASREQVVKAIFTFPNFSGLDHSRVLRQSVRLGNRVGLSRDQTVSLILTRPAFAGYSQRRTLAVMDAIRNAVRRTGVTISQEEAIRIYKKFYRRSPYARKGSTDRETVLARKGISKTSRFGELFQKRLESKRRRR